MESKKTKGLYFAGEVLHLDALTGGYNLQIACSTADTAAMAQQLGQKDKSRKLLHQDIAGYFRTIRLSEDEVVLIK